MSNELKEKSMYKSLLIAHCPLLATIESGQKRFIPSPKRYFINSYRVDYVPIGLGIVSTILDRVYFINKVNGNSISYAVLRPQ